MELGRVLFVPSKMKMICICLLLVQKLYNICAGLASVVFLAGVVWSIWICKNACIFKGHQFDKAIIINRATLLPVVVVVVGENVRGIQVK